MTVADDDDRVGYGRPPRHSRFKPGQSGDPRGRRPGAKGATAVLAAALAEKVAVTESGRRRRITKLEVLTKQFVNRAAGGDLGSGRLVFGLIATAGDRLFDHGTAITPDDEAALTRALARLAGLRPTERLRSTTTARCSAATSARSSSAPLPSCSRRRRSNGTGTST